MFPNKRGLKSKLEKIPKRQREQLFKWLTKKDALTYRQAIAALKEKFGVVACLANLSGFYHGYCLPRIQAKKKSQPERILLDVVLKRRGSGGWQITVLHHAPGVALYGHENLKALVRRARGL